jgi:hypothetical protein
MKSKVCFLIIPLTTLLLITPNKISSSEKEKTQVTINFHHPDVNGPITEVITITRENGKLMEATVHTKETSPQEESPDQ